MNNSERFWDRMSKNWDKPIKKLNDITLKTIDRTKKHLKIDDNVLDYGCGIGTITIEIANNVKEIVAIDISSGMIDVAIRKAGDRKIENIKFAQSTIFDERYKKESFNVIVAFNILHLLKDTKKVIHRINDLLMPGGLFISATASLGEKNTFLSFSLSLLSKIGIIPYVTNYNISDLKDLIVEGNFQIIETEHLSHKPPNYFIAAKKSSNNIEIN